ncbi:B-cell receptor-associated protein 31-like [Oppia nitens]|uniref:B-cell receptor-associated protein 31-like n=1 Tax=Oppia nitens TaxID=1686743 RepID=UPI0023DC4666|nr:B-cell receptor-associated protein 31-like [Oppia nitens]
MSVQWTLVACFLYAEIALVVLLILPFISAKTWQKFFKSRFLRSIESQANLYFMVFIVILVLLFIDSVREMSKYTSDKIQDSGHGHLDAEMQHSMKLFRAQRNFYIAGFALFLCLVVRRLVVLIGTQAQLEAQAEASIKQAKGASQHSRQLLEQLSTSQSRDNLNNENEGNKKIEKQENELRKLREDLATAKEDAVKYRVNCDAMRKQAESVSEEYDRLRVEHERLQRDFERQSNSGDHKKDK